MKQGLKVAALVAVSLGIIAGPMTYKANAASTTYVVDPAFEACTQKVLVEQRRPFKKDNCAERVQRFLNQYKFLMGANGDSNKVPRAWTTLAIDKKYGPLTRKTVQEYQRLKQNDSDPSAHSGPVDGKVGKLTWASIRRDCVDTWAARNFRSNVCYKRVTNR
ncbi:MAG TPA: peptidoglycan-binding domain-containing protein [Verrucomicrobiae bacterium]|nr:peptidoglycan-binding domain-containing protein [Verrucomicrobiae bacterium]